MRDRLMAILRLMPATSSTIDGQGKIRSFTSFSDLADYLIAHGVIVPPCKVGDTVYSIVEGIDLVLVGEVYEYVVGREHFVFRSTRKGYFTLDFTEIDIGKTVFLTREEAEKALAERSSHE